MKATLEFDLPEEAIKFRKCVVAQDLDCAIYEIYNYCRRVLKDEEPVEDQHLRNIIDICHDSGAEV